MSQLVETDDICEIDAILSWNLEEPEMLDGFLLNEFQGADTSIIECMYCEQNLAFQGAIAQHYSLCTSSHKWNSSQKVAASSRLVSSASHTFSTWDVLCKAFPYHADRVRYLLELDVECIYCGVELRGGMWYILPVC